MKFRPLFVLTALVSSASWAQPPACEASPTVVDVHWSERQTISSPNCKWSLEILPGKGDVGHAYLKSRDGKKSTLLFTVNRSGSIRWDRSDVLAFEDHGYSNTYRLRVFDLSGSKDFTAGSLQLDVLARKKIEGDLGPEQTIQYYFPKIVALEDGKLTVSVGVETTHGDEGPFTPHCYGFQLALHPARIVSSVTADELRDRFGASCQKFP